MNEQEQYLSLVLTKLKERIASLDASLAEGEKEVETMNDYYWENYTEMDEYGYENYDNQKALLGQILANNEQLDLKRRFRKMLDSPYFGRVDFCYEDESEPETYYIGIGNFAERPGMMPLVFDWRAPVAGLFYDFDKGPASFTAPGGVMEGELTAKWQYKIRKGRMIYGFESDVKIDDEVLKQELGQNGDVRLKNIVRTIQREQNAIIRNTTDKILIVQGCAGSGKTSVALHRIAYLLYHDRKNLTSKSVLVLSPSGVFTDYISHILPELGEQNIMEMSFDIFAYHELKKYCQDCQDRYDDMEQRLAGKHTPESAWKQTAECAREIRGYVLELEDELMNFRDFSWHKIFRSASELRDLFYNRFSSIPLLERMKAIMDYVVDAEETLRGKDFPDEEKAAIEEQFMKMYETRDIYILYSRFLTRIGLKGLPHQLPEERIIPYEDVFPMLYMKYQLESAGAHRQIRHLVIDEMQDYSYIQYLLITQLFPCEMTILGDKAQTMDDEEQDVMKFLPKLLGKNTRCITMNRSYRSTVEIMDYAKSLIETEEGEQVQRHGKVPELYQVDSIDEICSRVLETVRVEALTGVHEKFSPGKDEPHFETAAVLCMTEEQAKMIYSALLRKIAEISPEEEEGLCYLDKNSTRFREGLVVTTFYLAKGLEFDQVYTCCHAGDDRPLIRHARYICATRALHELYVLEGKENFTA